MAFPGGPHGNSREQSMESEPSTSRPPRRSRPRKLLILAALAAVAAVAVAWRMHAVERQQQAVDSTRAQIEQAGGHFVESLVEGTYTIDLSDCPFDDAKLETLAGRLAKFPGPGLYRSRDLNLILNGTQVTDAGIAKLQGLRITRLDVAGTAVGDASVETISGFALWFVDLRGSQVSEAGVARLRESLPEKCRISH